MNTKHSSVHSPAVSEDVRQTLCQVVARLLQAGANEIRLRCPGGGDSDQVWFYARTHNTWEKQEEMLTGRTAVAETRDLMEMLASRGKTDEVTVRVHTKPDYHDTELQFDQRWLEAHRDDGLDQTLYRVLCRDQHASELDVRRRIQPRHHGAK